MQQGGVEVLFISLWSEPGGRCTMIMIHKSFLGVPGEDGLDPNTAAEIELQETEAAWLELEKIQIIEDVYKNNAKLVAFCTGKSRAGV